MVKVPQLTRLVFGLFSLLLVFGVSEPVVLAESLSPDELKSIYSDTVWYSTQSTGCSAGIAGTLPASIPEPYNSLFIKAAAAAKMNPQFLAAIFLTEHGNVWQPANTVWASSSKGAQGPFQFMPGTWAGYKTDGDNDGKMDINSLPDAAFSAAKMLENYAPLNAPLGSLETPFKANTLLEAAAAYNWGPTNVQIHTNESSPITGDGTVPTETQNYLKNIYALLTSNFTKSGHPNYGDPRSEVTGATTAAASSGAAATAGCSGGVVAGSIVQTALNLAWSTPNHGKNKADAKPSYQIAMPKYNGSTGDDEWSDCGVFVATVMVASGADPDYFKRGSANQLNYARQHPEKYDVFDNLNNTNQLKPGDVFVNSQHTYIYTGDKTTIAVGASHTDHVPQVTIVIFDLNGEHFSVVRLK